MLDAAARLKCFVVWACHTCNGFEGKASRMEWNIDGSPKLLSLTADDPLEYLTVNLSNGPEFIGYTVRQRLLDLLAASEPYLAPVRQVLYAEPDYAHLRRELLAQIPELEPILAERALPPEEMMKDE